MYAAIVATGGCLYLGVVIYAVWFVRSGGLSNRTRSSSWLT